MLEDRIMPYQQVYLPQGQKIPKKIINTNFAHYNTKRKTDSQKLLIGITNVIDCGLETVFMQLAIPESKYSLRTLFW